MFLFANDFNFSEAEEKSVSFANVFDGSGILVLVLGVDKDELGEDSCSYGDSKLIGGSVSGDGVEIRFF